MYQIRIKIVTTKGIKDDNPSVNWIYPDKGLKKYAELKDVELNDMVVLHEDDVHFNLIISKNSDLAIKGSLSYRFNIGPTLTKNLDETNNGMNEDISDDHECDIVDK